MLFSARQKDTPATFQNDVTHWWDGSQLYGSDEQTSGKLRSFKNGKMKVSDKDGLLPVDRKTGIDQTGEFGDWYTIAGLCNIKIMREIYMLMMIYVACTEQIKSTKDTKNLWNRYFCKRLSS